MLVYGVGGLQLTRPWDPAVEIIDGSLARILKLSEVMIRNEDVEGNYKSGVLFRKVEVGLIGV